MLSQANKKTILDIWKHYDPQAQRMPNPSGVEIPSDLDARRSEHIPAVRKLIEDYLGRRSQLAEMKSANDGLNKSKNYWGFRGMNGQMFFNMLYNSSEEQGGLGALDTLLAKALPAPKSPSDAKAKIEALVKFSTELGEKHGDKRQAPRTGSCLFFLSFFWQIQSPDRWPIYYNSMVEVLVDESIWSPTGDYGADYLSFCQLNEEMQALIAQTAKKTVTLWDIEHAIWIWGKREPEAEVQPGGAVHPPQASDLPTSFLPPVVAALSQLAKNDPSMQAACAKAGVSVEKTFEERIGHLFRMVGFDVTTLGQGKGREPDGIATSQEHRYAIVYDAKVRQGGYSVGTDDRAIKEYIGRHTERLRKSGIKNVYFAVISSNFADDYDEVIRSLKVETDIREVLFIEADALLTFLEQRLRNPSVDLGQSGLQGLLVNSGVISKTDMLAHLGV